jgi:hypothetical protein
MKRILPILILALCGCTTYRVTQEDSSDSGRNITLDIRATAWFSSGQNIAGITAQQTDKTQSFGTKSLSQAGPTNTVATLEALTKMLQSIRP